MQNSMADIGFKKPFSRRDAGRFDAATQRNTIIKQTYPDSSLLLSFSKNVNVYFPKFYQVVPRASATLREY
jgi:hypothetical protein